jgi:hypothetical protein
VRRSFRGTPYVIEVQNPDGHSKGIRKLMVDGIPQQDNLIPARQSSDTVHVLAVL